MEILKIENGVKKLLIIAQSEEDRTWLKLLGDSLTVHIITDNGASVLGQPVHGSLLLTQKKQTNE